MEKTILELVNSKDEAGIDSLALITELKEEHSVIVG